MTTLGWNDLQMSFKVIERGTNRKLVYELLSAVYSDFRRITHRFRVTRSFNLLGGITLLRNSVPKAVEVSSRLRRLRGLDWMWLRCGARGHSRLSPNDNFTTIPRPRADSSEVDCNQYALVSLSASDYSCSAISSMSVRLLRFDIFQRHRCYLYFCCSHVLTVNRLNTVMS